MNSIKTLIIKAYRYLFIQVTTYNNYYGRVLLLINNIKYGKGINIYGKLIINKNRLSTIRIGNFVHIQSRNSMYYLNLNTITKFVTVKKEANITIGNGCDINGSTLSCRSTSISIGNDVLIAGNCTITDSDWHNVLPIDKRSREYCQFVATDKAVYIEDNVWIGLNCIILKGVKIGKGSVIAAGSVVVCDIPPMVVAGGNPAKVIKYLK